MVLTPALRLIARVIVSEAAMAGPEGMQKMDEVVFGFDLAI